MLTTWMLDWVLRATVILTLAWATALVLRRRAAALRHLVWTLALASLLLLPTASAVLPPWTAAISGRPPAQAAIVAFETALPAVAVRAPQRRSDTPPWPLLLWGLGFTLVMFRWTRGALRTHALLRRSGSADYALPLLSGLRRQAQFEREIRVCKSPDVAVALVWGVLRPVIILPKEATGWDSDRLRAVLAHELAHLRRWDLATQLLAQLVCALYWFHPLVWLAFQRMRQERERACDDAVLAEGISGPDYAGYLVDLVRTLAAHPPADAPAMAEARDLELRVRAVLNPTQERRGAGRKLAFVLSLATAVFVMALASFRATAQTSAGAIYGTVTDPTGAVIARAQVTARNLETGSGVVTEVVTVADQAGSFRFALAPGTYAVEIYVPGFDRYDSRVTVSPGYTARVDARLVVSGAIEAVTVRARGNPSTANSRPAAPVRIRVGGNVQTAKPVSTPPPVYPESLQQRGVHGSVLLHAIVDKTGQVIEARVVNLAEIEPQLAAIALETVTTWAYTPALLNGEPISTMITIAVNFDLVP